jgi:transposase-like protein
MSDSVTARQRRAIEALVAGATVTAAAETAGVSRQTVYAWMRQGDFAEALDNAGAEVRRAAVRRLTAALDRAVTTVSRLAETAEDEAVRLRSALAVASMLRDLLGVDEQVAQMRAAGNGAAARLQIEYTNDWRKTFVFDHDVAVASITANADKE